MKWTKSWTDIDVQTAIGNWINRMKSSKKEPIETLNKMFVFIFLNALWRDACPQQSKTTEGSRERRTWFGRSIHRHIFTYAVEPLYRKAHMTCSKIFLLFFFPSKKWKTKSFLFDYCNVYNIFEFNFDDNRCGVPELTAHILLLLSACTYYYTK